MALYKCVYYIIIIIMKFGCVVFEICKPTESQTKKQTDTHTYTLIAVPYWGRSRCVWTVVTSYILDRDCWNFAYLILLLT